MRFLVCFLILIIGQIAYSQGGPKLILPLGHNALITKAVYNNDGKKIATIGFDQTIVIWDAITAKSFTQLKGKVYPFGETRFSDDDRFFISVSDEGIRKWNIMTGEIEYKQESSDFDLQPARTRGQIDYSEEKYEKEIVDIDLMRSKYLYFCYGPKDDLMLSRQFIPYQNEKIQYILKLETDFKDDTITIKSNGSDFLDVKHSSNLSKIITCNSKNEVKVYDSKTGNIVSENIVKNYTVQRVDISKDGKYYVTYGEKNVELWDAKTNIVLKDFKGVNTINSIRFNPKYNKLIETTSYKAKIFNLANLSYEKELNSYTLEKIFTKEPEIYDSNGTEVSWIKGNEKMSFNFSKGKIEMIPVSQDSLIKLSKKPEFSSNLVVLHTALSPNGKLVSYSTDDMKVKVFNKTKSSEVMSISESKGIVKSTFSLDNKRLLVSNGNVLKIYDLESKKLILKIIEENFEIVSEIEFVSHEEILISYSNSTKFDVYNIKNKKVIKTINENNEEDEDEFDISKMMKIYKKQFHYDKSSTKLFFIQGEKVIAESLNDYGHLELELDNSNYVIGNNVVNDILLVSNDMNIHFIDVNNFEIKLTITEISPNDYLLYDFLGYYSCSINSANKLAWKDDYNFYDFDQFDVYYNRPDKVLDDIGCSDKELIISYYAAYKARLKWLGLNLKNESLEDNDRNLIYATIKNKAEIEGETDKEVVEIVYESEVIAGNSFIKEIYYSIDGSPYLIDTFSNYNKAARALRADKRVGTLRVKLLPGLNTIKLYCKNNYGIESLKDIMYIDYRPSTVRNKNKLYIICISTDKYKDPKNNLKYCKKDSRDLIKQFKLSKNYSSVNVDTLFDFNVTSEGLKKIKQNLQTFGAEDEVIISISGHGILSSNGDFFLPTSNTDFNIPEVNSLSFGEVNRLLDGILPRKKLLLIDACHSGVYLKNSKQNIESTKNDIENISAKGSTPVYSVNEHNGALIQQMQDLFTNLSISNGAITFTASSGANYAIELENPKNGLFTYAIISALKNKEADINNDNILSLEEFDKYVKKTVMGMSDGKQIPSNRQVNWQTNWNIWVY
jgi:WD40 repeat protein